MFDLLNGLKGSGMMGTAKQKKMVVELDPYKIKANKNQPRQRFDLGPIYELCESIKIYGIIQPLTVRRVEGGTYELISGERRLRAAIMAELKTVPAIVLEASDNDSAVMALIENIQRQDLTFFEEAEAYYYLVAEQGITQERLAVQMGKTQSTIANKLRLLRLPLSVKHILIENELSERHARALLRLPDEKSQIKIIKMICENGYSVKQTDNLVDIALEKLGEGKAIREKNKESNGYLKDVRVLVNTVKQAVDMMVKSGIGASFATQKTKDYTEYVIKVPKKQEKSNKK